MPLRTPLATVFGLLALLVVCPAGARASGIVSNQPVAVHPQWVPAAESGLSAPIEIGNISLTPAFLYLPVVSDTAMSLASAGDLPGDSDTGSKLTASIFIVILLGGVIRYFTSPAWRNFINEVFFPQSY